MQGHYHEANVISSGRKNTNNKGQDQMEIFDQVSKGDLLYIVSIDDLSVSLSIYTAYIMPKII